MTAEPPFETRFFAVRIAADSTAIEVDVTNIATATANQAEQYAYDLEEGGINHSKNIYYNNIAR